MEIGMKRLIAALMIVLSALTVRPAGAGPDDAWIQIEYTVTGAAVASGSVCGDTPQAINEILIHRLTSTSTEGHWYRATEVGLFQVSSIDDGPNPSYAEYFYWQPAAVGEEFWIFAMNNLTGTCNISPPLVVDATITKTWIPGVTK